LASPHETLTDPNLLQFAERIWDKGGLPVLVLIGLFALLWKLGWPKFSAASPAPPTTREDLRDDLADFRHDVIERLERIENKQNIMLDRTQRK
jgi:hypothetical protein